MCLLPVESSDVARQYQKVLQIFFVDGDSEMFEMVVEPVIKETYDRFLHSRDGDPRITSYTLTGDTIQFQCSDILYMTETETSGPEYSLLYPAHLRMVEWEGGLLYEIDESDILGVLCLK